jgi:hypothetical protein
MLIDRHHRPWFAATLILGGGALAAYIFDPQAPMQGRGGGTIAGLTLGIAAYGIMLFCAALSVKRRVPHWKIGPARAWLRGHIWLGLLAVWLVALHASFSLGGPLTAVLWALLGIVTVSALFGIILQQLVPRLLLHSVPGETLAQQLDRQLSYVSERLAATIVEYAGSIHAAAPGWSAQAATVYAEREKAALESIAEGSAAATVAPPVDHRVHDMNKPPFGAEPLRRFYHEYIIPFLQPTQRVSPLANAGRADSLFVALRTMTPPHIHPGIDEVRDLVTRRRMLLRQRDLMRILFAWLLVHVPMSWGLLLLVGAHAIYALRFLQH